MIEVTMVRTVGISKRIYIMSGEKKPKKKMMHRFR